MEERLILCKNGKYYQPHEFRTAYYLSTGKDPYALDNEEDYDKWLKEKQGISIDKVVDVKDVTYEELLEGGQKIMAVRLYRERNNCTLREAKDSIDSIEENMEHSGPDLDRF